MSPHVSKHAIVLALAVLGLAQPAAAQDQQSQGEDKGNYVTVFYIRNFGGNLLRDEPATRGVGLSWTFWAPGPLAAEIDFGYSPEFFGPKELLSDNSLLTFTFNGIVGPWIPAGAARFRPYGVFGGGLMRSKIEDFKILGKDVKNKGMLDLGGGLVVVFSEIAGVRADVRHIWGVGATDNSAGWGLIDKWTYLRATIGGVVMF